MSLLQTPKLADVVPVQEHSHRGNYKQIGFKCSSSTIESWVIAVQLGTEWTEVQHKHRGNKVQLTTHDAHLTPVKRWFLQLGAEWTEVD